MGEQTYEKELKNALAQIEKQFGRGAIMKLGEGSAADVQGISTGALSLDIFLCVCALIPAAALVLLLSPSTFASWWRWPRVFTITVVATGLLLLPGAAGLVSLGVQAAGISSAQPAATSTSTPGLGCGGAR